LHEPVVHVPEEHAGVPFAVVQTMLQPPQLLTSLQMSVSHFVFFFRSHSDVQGGHPFRAAASSAELAVNMSPLEVEAAE
jgi:hypothetical protein